MTGESNWYGGQSFCPGRKIDVMNITAGYGMGGTVTTEHLQLLERDLAKLYTRNPNREECVQEGW